MSLNVQIWETITDLWDDIASGDTQRVKYNLQTDFMLTYLGKTIDNPTPKYTQIEVPFRDGVLDLTDALGGLHYGIRDITMRFELMCHRWEFDSYRSQIWMALHGRSVVAILPDSPANAWTGRMEVTDFVDNGSTATMFIVLHAQPYNIVTSALTGLIDAGWNPSAGFTTQITVPSDYPKHWFLFYGDYRGGGTIDLPIMIDDELYTIKDLGEGREWSPDDFWLDAGTHTLELKPVSGASSVANIEIAVFGGGL